MDEDNESSGPSSTVHIGVVRWAGAERNTGVHTSSDGPIAQRAVRLSLNDVQSPARVLAFPTPSRALGSNDDDAPSPTSGVRWAGDATPSQVERAAPAARPAAPPRYTWLRTDTPLK